MSTQFDALKKRADAVLCYTYGRYPVAVKKAKGSRIWDFDGKEYIDLLAGIAVTSVGHCNEEVAEAMAKQAAKLVHVSNLFYQEEQVELAERLVNTCHCDKVFFCNSGAEANEAAIKLVRRYQQVVRERFAYEVITFDHCFHGRTMATLTATSKERVKDGFEPALEGFVQVPWGDLEALEKAIGQHTAAVMLEMVQGEGGVRPVTKEFAQGVQAICKKHGLLFIADEVQAGLCRCGSWWSYQQFGVQPDAFTSAKALANGVPMGALVCTDEAARAFEPGTHASTFGGNALASAVACKVLDIMERDGLAARAAELGGWFKARLEAVQRAYPMHINEVRGLGLLIGVEMAYEAKPLWETLIAQGFILNLTHGTVLRLVPALTITRDDLEKFAQALEGLLKQGA